MTLKERLNTLRFSIFFWTIYFLYEWLGRGASIDQYEFYFVKSYLIVPFYIIVSYLSVHFLFNAFYFKNKKVSFWTGQIIVALVFVMFIRVVSYYYFYPNYYPKGNNEVFFFIPKILIEFVNLYLVVSLYGMFIFMKSWYKQQQMLQELSKEKMAAELELLKSQVQPHFIFNMLNNIYSGAFKKSPETAQQILKLSNFIEYSLYDSKKDMVLLTEELTYIQNYIDLQKIRVGEKLDVSINIFDNINEIQLPPMLLLPIIENCFKHGVNSSIQYSWIRFDISVKEHEVTFKVENSIENESPKNINQNCGLGLNNVKRRLEILYPDKHTFRVYQEQNSYLVLIKLPCNQ
ncbi:putative signal transduction histidine kinase (plasmid) [Emticicia oligotrophica DSM 17448]|uniref:Signal transduction histidine kinase n=1 Tax=Emticicia oligotrophica (strain DSM 17448 / CIP 109782 / MTCC 6937 / GPTSA100-15) TaxID=929562 RepID=A0ABN4AS84_EMTOG|nr:histidine kinase [Emticicia oligotrophica]AFK05527.1 putative signal transduction histidine kinase [Emticicia oligotrophica DSM 17448]